MASRSCEEALAHVAVPSKAALAANEVCERMLDLDALATLADMLPAALGLDLAIETAIHPTVAGPTRQQRLRVDRV